MPMAWNDVWDTRQTGRKYGNSGHRRPDLGCWVKARRRCVTPRLRLAGNGGHLLACPTRRSAYSQGLTRRWTLPPLANKAFRWISAQLLSLFLRQIRHFPAPSVPAHGAL